jgi:hypothetical protein
MHRNFAQAADTENFIDQTGIVHLMHELIRFDTGHLCSMSSPAGFISAAASFHIAALPLLKIKQEAPPYSPQPPH